MSDMRGWIKELEAAGELLRIKKPVNLKTEMGPLTLGRGSIAPEILIRA